MCVIAMMNGDAIQSSADMLLAFELVLNGMFADTDGLATTVSQNYLDFSPVGEGGPVFRMTVTDPWSPRPDVADDDEPAPGLSADEEDLIAVFHDSDLDIGEAVARLKRGSPSGQGPHSFRYEAATTSKLSRDERHLLAAWKATGLGLDAALLALDDRHSRRATNAQTRAMFAAWRRAGIPFSAELVALEASHREDDAASDDDQVEIKPAPARCCESGQGCRFSFRRLFGLD